MTDADGVTPTPVDHPIVASVGNGVSSQPRGLRIAVLAIAGMIAATDQLTKSIVLATHAGTAIPRSSGWFSIELVRNHGASTGIGASHPLLVTAVETVGTVLVAALALRVRRTVLALALATVLGGALGNLLDRFVRAPGLGRGAVVDWIHLAGRGGSLDLADVAIQLGALVALIATLLGSRQGRAAPTEDARTEAHHRPPPTEPEEGNLMTEVARSRPARPQAVLSVRSSEWLSPSMIRLVVGGDGFDAFQSNGFSDKYVKLLFVDPALELTPPYDLAALRESLPPEQRPVTRTYTVRRVDPDRQQLTIDFVVHGPDGIAAPWASRAQVGELLTLTGAGGAYSPDPSQDWHLFIGDESARPAISAALDALPRDARGIAYLESHPDDALIDTDVPAGIDVIWLPREHPGTTPHLLADAVTAGEWLTGVVGVFAHGERESMKAVRAALKSRDLGTGTLSLSGYWAYGRSEDRFQAEKREPIGQIEG